jgi:hypothetical protein
METDVLLNQSRPVFNLVAFQELSWYITNSNLAYSVRCSVQMTLKDTYYLPELAERWLYVCSCISSAHLFSRVCTIWPWLNDQLGISVSVHIRLREHWTAPNSWRGAKSNGGQARVKLDISVGRRDVLKQLKGKTPSWFELTTQAAVGFAYYWGYYSGEDRDKLRMRKRKRKGQTSASNLFENKTKKQLQQQETATAARSSTPGKPRKATH